MRICRITTTFVPPWRGLGPGPYELSRAQAERGHRLTVLTREAPGSGDIDRASRFVTHRIKAGFSFSFSLRAARRFLELHRREPFDLVHNHGESAVALLLLRPLLPISVPVISSVHIFRRTQFRHDGVAPSIGERMARRKALFYERLYIGLSDALATVNGSLTREVAEEFRRCDNVFTVYNGAAFGEFRPGGPARRGEGRRLLFVGRLNGRKGEGDLLQALATVRAERPDVSLLLVGEGPAEPGAHSLAQRLGLGSAVTFEPYLPREELRRRYRSSDLFVLPSYSEGLPKVLLEAMASGVPVAVSDIPAHTELIADGETGYLFRAGDPASIARTLLTALGDPRRPEIAARASELVREQYTWDAVAARLDEIYNAIIE